MIEKPPTGRKSLDIETSRLENTRRRKPWIGGGRRREPVKEQFYIY